MLPVHVKSYKLETKTAYYGPDDVLALVCDIAMNQPEQGDYVAVVQNDTLDDTLIVYQGMVYEPRYK